MSEENSLLNEVDFMHLRDAHREWLRSLEYINNINSEKAFIAGAEFMISEKLSSYKWEQAYHNEATNHVTTAINLHKLITQLEKKIDVMKEALGKIENINSGFSDARTTSYADWELRLIARESLRECGEMK